MSFSIVLSALISAFVTGALARFAVPGPDPMPAWLTVVIGLVGTVIGGGIAIAIFGRDATWVGVFGFLVAIVLVLLYRRFIQKRAIWGPDAYRFPKRGFGVQHYRERLNRAGIDPDTIGEGFSALASARAQAAGPGMQPGAAAAGTGDDPTENPAYYIRLLDELHDNGVLSDDEYTASRTRLLEQLRA
jgi:uncharacterized membrane protein YeaQ/YmgE (transglycosylase-associated protein family)